MIAMFAGACGACCCSRRRRRAAHGGGRKAPISCVFGQLSEVAPSRQRSCSRTLIGCCGSITAVDEPPAENKFHIYLVRGHSRARRDPHRAAAGVGGFYTATARRHRRVRRREPGAERENTSCSTNMRIISCGRTLPSYYPAWYRRKALPNTSATARFTARKIDIGRYDAETGLLPSCTTLAADGARFLSGSPMGLNRERLAVYYAAELAADPLFLQHAGAAGGTAETASRPLRRDPIRPTPSAPPPACPSSS